VAAIALANKIAAHLLVGSIGEADAARLCYAFEARGDINSIAKQVLAFDHHIPNIDSHTKLNPSLGRGVGVPAIHPTLDIERAAHRIYDRGKLDQNAVACGFHDPAEMERYGRVDQLAAQLAEAPERAFLIQPSQPRIARHVGGQDGGKLPGRVHDPSRVRLEATR
jgi:hypothetical protein